MVSWSQLKWELDRYNLTYVWDFDLYGDYSLVQGYLIRSDTFKSLGRLPVSDLVKMSLAELEEFVVGCSVLSMSGHEG